MSSRNLLNARQTSSEESDASNVPGNPQLDSNSVSGNTWNHVQDSPKPSDESSRVEEKQPVSGEHMGSCAE